MHFLSPANAWGNYWIPYHKTNKEASTVLCSVVKHWSSGELQNRSRSREKLLTMSRVFPYTSFMLYHFLRASQQNKVQLRLLNLLNIDYLSISMWVCFTVMGKFILRQQKFFLCHCNTFWPRTTCGKMNIEQ